jgi:formylmethanofuran dehydrogenase subunit B
MGEIRIDGSPAELAAAIAQAARLLGASRLPVIAGLGCDVAGARASVALARALGGVVDHMHSDALLRDLDVAREAGVMVTTANEARLRADTVLAVGPGLDELIGKLAGPPTARELGDGAKRRVFRLCPGQASKTEAGIIGRHARDLPVLLAALRTRLAGRPVGRTRVAMRALDELASDLRAARFGVAVWSAAALDALSIEMLCGLVDDLNAHTRFSGLPAPPGDDAIGILQACGWLTGFPMRTGFARGAAEHDPWRFDAARLVESGEADCALWISAYAAVAPPWRRDVPLIALTRPGTRFRSTPQVEIEVAHPGIDHDAVEHLPATGTLTSIKAAKPTDLVSVAAVIGRIAAELRRPPC